MHGRVRRTRITLDRQFPRDAARKTKTKEGGDKNGKRNERRDCGNKNRRLRLSPSELLSKTVFTRAHAIVAHKYVSERQQFSWLSAFFSVAQP